MRLFVVALLVSLPLPCAARSSLTMEDCEIWLQQLQGEVEDVQVSGSEGASEHEALLKDLKQASLRRKGAKAEDSLKQVGKFKKRAGQLAAEGRVQEVEGQRLKNLSDTITHCIEQVDQEE